jgi:hypothetical protein
MLNVVSLKPTCVDPMTEPIEHPDFGAIVWDKNLERFATTVGVGRDAFALVFDSCSPDRLNDILNAAATLWRDREQWFSQWRTACYKYYIERLKDEWYEGDEPLDERTFNTKLGQPAGIDFSWSDGKLHYMITGMSEDLVGDHALEAHGTGLTPSEICLT